MSSKFEYCFKVLRTYGLLVNFDGEVSRVNVPAPLEDNDETITQWRKRVLGPDVSNLVVYMPEVLTGTRKLSKLQRAVDATHLRQVLRAQGKAKEALGLAKTEKAVEKTERMFSTFSKDTIQDYLDELGDSLEPSVKEFFERQIEKSTGEIGADKLLQDLIIRFNDVAQVHRRLVEQRKE